MSASARTLLQVAIVAIAYFATGRLSLLLAIPPGYATAVWPPSGIAMAAAILWGPSAIVGVLLGHFAVNLFLGGGAPVAAVIALGGAMQAAAGAALSQRLSGPGNPLDHGGSALRPVLVGGPLSCIVAASCGVATLVTSGTVPADEAAFHWATWWAGDTIGVLLVVPPLLAWTAQPAETWRWRRWTLAAPLLACFVAVVIAFVHARGVEARRESMQFEERQRPLAEAILVTLTRVSDAVVGVAAFVEASESVTDETFRVFVAPKLARGLGIQALSWNPILSERVPVRYIEPRLGNAAAVGFDIASEPTRRAAVEAARRRDAPTVSARLQLVQEQAESWGVLLLTPTSDPPGFAVAAVRLDDLVERALGGPPPAGLAVRLRDLDAPPELQWLYGGPGPADLAVQHEWTGGGRRWELEIASLTAAQHAWSTWAVLAGGLLFAGLLGAFVLELVTRQLSVERLVAARTAELARANAELEQSNIELRRFTHVASHDLREPLRAIASYAQLLLESGSELSDSNRGYLERLRAAARRMQALIDDLLALSRIEGGGTSLAPTALGEVVAVVLENLRESVRDSGAILTIGALPTVSCDAGKVVPLFQNLLANAIKFRREGVTPIVRVEARPVGNFWEIAITDNGIGIAPEHRARVFEMFERLHPRARYPGTGIGLAIGRRVVELHGGRIWVESGEDGGSVFRFTLPAIP